MMAVRTAASNLGGAVWAYGSACPCDSRTNFLIIETWGESEDAVWAIGSLKRLLVQYDGGDKIPWRCLREYGLINRLMPVKRGQGSSGRILAHCKQMVSSFRESMGLSLTVFKIGVTAEPVSRFLLYLPKNYTTMWAIHSSMDVREIHMLEAALISLFENAVGIQNAPKSGGEGALNRHGAVGPFYAYVVGGRADQNRRVG